MFLGLRQLQPLPRGNPEKYDPCTRMSCFWREGGGLRRAERYEISVKKIFVDLSIFKNASKVNFSKRRIEIWVRILAEKLVEKF